MGLKTSSVVLGFAAFAAIGFAMGYLTFGGIPAAQPPADPAPGSEAPVASSHALRPVATADAPVREAVKVTKDAPPADPAAVERAVRSAPSKIAIAAAAGAGSVSGTVQDNSGKPVEGVTIRLQPKYYKKSTDWRGSQLSAPRLQTLEEYLQGMADTYQRTVGSMRQTLTAADGTYRFEDVPNQRYSISAYSLQFDVVADDLSSSGNIHPGDTMNFTAVPVCALPVRVIDARGAEVESASVAANQSWGNRRTSSGHEWSRDDPVLYLSPGAYELVAQLEFDASGLEALVKSDPTPVEVVAGRAQETVTLQLKQRLGIGGRVFFPKGEDERQGVVQLMELTPGTEPDLKRLSESSKKSHLWGQASKYQFSDLAPGTYVVGAKRDWNAPIVVHAVVVLQDKPVVQNLEMPEASPQDSFIVVATTKSGKPADCTDFNFIHRRGDRGTSSMYAQGRARSNGEYWVSIPADIAPLFTKKWPAGQRLSLTIQTASFGSQEVELAEGQRSANVLFTEPAKLTVTVAGYRGSGYEGRVTVSLVQKGNSDRGWSAASKRVGADGVAVSDPMQPGEYDVNLNVSKGGTDRSWDATVAATRTVRLVEGDNAITMPLPQLYNVAIHVPDAGAGVRVSLQAQDREEGRGGSSEETQENGTATFENLAPGEYLATLQRNGVEVMKITVPAEGVVEFKAMKANALRIRIRDASGPAAKAGLRTGDLVIGIDGKEFDSINAMQAQFFAASAKGSESKLKILRGGAAIEIAVDLATFMRGGGGMSIDPAVR
jgi:hypothetical protein